MGIEPWQKGYYGRNDGLNSFRLQDEYVNHYLKNAAKNVSSASNAHGRRAPKVLRHIACWERSDGTSEVHNSTVRLKGLVIILAVKIGILSVSCCWEPAVQPIQRICGLFKWCIGG